MSENNNISPEQPPAGWYPDPHEPTAQRYWDGSQWTDHAAVPVAEHSSAVPVEAPPSPSPAGAAGGVAGGALTVSRKRGLPKLKWWQWALIAFGVLVLISMIVNGINGGRGAGDAAGDEPSTVAEQAEDVPVAEPVPVDDREEIPGLVGLTVADARAALQAAGFVIAMPDGTGDDWVVSAQTLSEGRKADAGTEVLVTAEAPKPVYTLAQQNAISKAQDYLDYSGFSRTGLIDQLEYEGYSAEDATFGTDNAGADWNAEAAEKAADYMAYSSFSRQGLYDQLAYEGFTDAEIQFGLAAVGY